MATTEQTMQSDSGVKQFMGDHPLVSVIILTVVFFVLLAVVLYAAIGIAG